MPVEQSDGWVIIDAPGYLGSRKDAYQAHLNETYGSNQWRYAWKLADGQVWNFEQVFWQGYVAAYAKYFHEHSKEADDISENFAYTYDKDLVTKEQAFI